MIEGNDGGACVTFNGAQTWSTIYNQPTAQFYHVCADDQQPYRIYGSQQDNWAISLPSQSHRGAITATDWVQPGGGESGYIAVKPGDPAIVVGGSVGSGPGMGRLIHYDHRTGQERIISVWPETYGMGTPPAEHRHRFQWTFPVFYSRWDPRELWIAGNRVFRSLDEGQSWDVVSPDLTRNDPAKLGPSGGPITRDNTGAEVYCTIFALAESPHERDVLWAGTDDGLVHLSRDRGRTWQAVTPPDLPEWALVSVIEPSAHDAATCYVAATRYKLDDTRPYLYRTSDYGRTWTRITGSLPDGEITRVVREDPGRRGLLYCGTETGVWVSLDDGGTWQRLRSNLPVAPIHDLIVKGTDLVVATHGRSFWILDDVTPLHQMADGVASADAHLFAPRPAVRWRAYRGHGMKPGPNREVAYRLAGSIGYAFRQVESPTGEKQERLLDAGENPPNGVTLHYWLKEAPVGDVTLAFLDAAGREIRSFTSRRREQAASGGPPDDEPRLTKNAGANRFVWNLRGPDATRLPDNKGRGGTAEMLAGPRMPPGSYQARLTVGGRTLTQPFEVVKDPRVQATDGDLREQFTWAKKAHDLLKRVHDAVLTLRDARAQAEAWAGRVESPAVKEAARALARRLTAIEEELIQVRSEDPRMFPAKLNSRVAAVMPLVEYSDSAPTQALRELVDSLALRAGMELAKLDHCLAEDVAAFNAICRDAGRPRHRSEAARAITDAQRRAAEPGARGRRLPHRLLGAARWALRLLERLGEGEQLGVGPVQVDLLAEGLADLVGGRVVELDAVVLGVEEVDAARDPVGDRALDPHARVLEAVIERAHVVQALHLEGDLLHVVRLLRRLPGLGERQLVVLGVGLRAQEADAPLEVLVGDREAQDARVEVPHLPEVVAVESDVTQSADLWHGSLRSQVCL